MTVTPEQWADVAAEIGVTVGELRERIAGIDNSWAAKNPERQYGPAYFDRDNDPLTLGEWAWLYEARCYKFIEDTTLPNGYWVATIWHGVRDFDGDGTVLETSVFPAAPEEGERLPSPLERVTHPSMVDALRAHAVLVAIYAHLDSAGPPVRRAAQEKP